MAIGLILLLGLVLRLINLNQSLWLDEAVQAITSQGSLMGIFSELRGDFHPPLYHILMWAWVHLFGSSEVILRLPSVLFGVGTIWVVWKIAQSSKFKAQSSKPQLKTKKLKINNTFPVVSAILIATAPYHIYYSQEARMYAMVTFFACLSMYWFIKLLTSEVSNPDTGSKKVHLSTSLKATLQVAGLPYIFATTFMLYSDYYGFLVLLAQMITALIIFKKKFTVSLSRCLAVMLFFLPCLPLLFIQLRTGLQSTQSLPAWGELVNVSFLKALPLTFVKFTIGRITIFNKKLYAIVGGILFLVYGSIIARGFLKKKKYYILHTTYYILFLWLIVPISIAWIASLFIPNYQPFRLLLVLPAFYLLLSMGIVSIKNNYSRMMVLLFVLVTGGWSLATYYSNSYFHREDWRGVVQFIESQEKPSLAVLPASISDWPWRYYSQNKVKLVSVSHGVNEAEKGEVVNNLTIKQFNNSTIYYIRYLVDLFDPQELIVGRLNGLGYVKIEEISFNQIPVWIYEKEDIKI